MPDARAPDGWLRRRLRSRRVVVVDASMVPALTPGDRLLVDPGPGREGAPRIGDIVVLHDPQAPARLLVKRVAALDPRAGTVSVVGDAPEASRDSRAFGPVPVGSLVGVAWFRYLPRERRGPLSGGPPSVVQKA